MAITQIEESPRIITPRNSRRNEIVAILLLALGLLMTLCLVSAAFYPNDPSWNSAGQSETHNWAGSIGAGVAAGLLQSIGLAAYLLPVLLLATAWRRFRTRSLHAPWSRIAGLLVLVLSAASLLSISGLHPLFDASVQPGGLLGSIIAQLLAGGLNTVGATVLLAAIAATGVLLVTNFSFVNAYEVVIKAAGSRFGFVRALPERFKAFRASRREQARLRKEKKRHSKPKRKRLATYSKAIVACGSRRRIHEGSREATQTQPISVVRAVAITEQLPQPTAPLKLQPPAQRWVWRLQRATVVDEIIPADALYFHLEQLSLTRKQKLRRWLKARRCYAQKPRRPQLENFR